MCGDIDAAETHVQAWAGSRSRQSHALAKCGPASTSVRGSFHEGVSGRADGGAVSSHGDRGLFRAFAKSLAVLSDPLAWNSSRFYRDRAEPWYADVASGVDGLEAGDLREWCRALI